MKHETWSTHFVVCWSSFCRFIIIYCWYMFLNGDNSLILHTGFLKTLTTFH